MLRIGLTGGIASGKSTVARAFVALGVPVVDADALYHALVAPQGQAPSPLTQRIAARFAGVLKADGSLDRRTLGATVFADAAKRRALEAITHPAVAEAAEAAFVDLEAAGHPFALYDVPLLYERGLTDRFAGVVVVWVPRALQLQRLRARDGIDVAAAEARLRAQLSLDDKRAQARWVIDNSHAPAATQAQVQALCQQLGALAKATGQG